MPRYTPAELSIIRRLADALLAAGVPTLALQVFGSRVRGHSDANSDLDIAVVVDSPPDHTMERKVAAIAEELSFRDEMGSYALRLQAVPFFRGDESGFLARAIAREADTVWTRT